MGKHFMRQDGTFAGTFVDGEPKDKSLIEVPVAPPDGRMVWDLGAWRQNPNAKTEFALTPEMNGLVKFLADRFAITPEQIASAIKENAK